MRWLLLSCVVLTPIWAQGDLWSGLDSSAVFQMVSDSSATASSVPTDSLSGDSAFAPVKDSARVSSRPDSVGVPAPARVSPRDVLGPVKVSRVRGIDEMKGRYKSPRKALFLSLAVPGAGQFYVAGSGWNYARGAFYLAAEGILGAYWYRYSVSLYNKQVRKYEAFARRHFSVGSYEARIHSLYGELSDVDKQADFAALYLIGREEYCAAIYRNATTNRCFERGEIPDYLTRDQNHMALFPAGVSLDSSLRMVSLWDESRFFQILARGEMVLGWDDVDSLRGAGELDLTNQVYVPLGVSANQKTYERMRARANDLAGMQTWFLGGILLNHLVSAVDATLAAYQHNKGLYEEKLSWWERVRLQSYFHWRDGLSASLGAWWAF